MALIIPLLRREFTRTKPPGDRRNKGVCSGKLDPAVFDRMTSGPQLAC